MGAYDFTESELMIANAARELAGEHVVFVGVGIPNIAVSLAKRTVAPNMEMVYEGGVFGAQPPRLPLSIGDSCLVTGAGAPALRRALDGNVHKRLALVEVICSQYPVWSVWPGMSAKATSKSQYAYDKK